MRKGDGNKGGALGERLLHRNVQRFRGGLAFEADRFCVLLNSQLERNEEEEGVEGVMGRSSTASETKSIESWFTNLVSDFHKCGFRLTVGSPLWF